MSHYTYLSHFSRHIVRGPRGATVHPPWQVPNYTFPKTLRCVGFKTASSSNFYHSKNQIVGVYLEGTFSLFRYLYWKKGVNLQGGVKTATLGSHMYLKLVINLDICTCRISEYNLVYNIWHFCKFLYFSQRKQVIFGNNMLFLPIFVSILDYKCL